MHDRRVELRHGERRSSTAEERQLVMKEDTPALELTTAVNEDTPILPLTAPIDEDTPILSLTAPIDEDTPILSLTEGSREAPFLDDVTDPLRESAGAPAFARELTRAMKSLARRRRPASSSPPSTLPHPRRCERGDVAAPGLDDPLADVKARTHALVLELCRALADKAGRPAVTDMLRAVIRDLIDTSTKLR